MDENDTCVESISDVNMRLYDVSVKNQNLTGFFNYVGCTHLVPRISLPRISCFD